MRGKASKRREIILVYIDRARHSLDEADAGNNDFIWTLKTEQKRRKQESRTAEDEPRGGDLRIEAKAEKREINESKA